MTGDRSPGATWGVVALIVTLTALAVAATLLSGLRIATLEARAEARAAAADAASPVMETLRDASVAAVDGTASNARVVPADDAAAAGLTRSEAARARDTGRPLLEDDGTGAVVVATYAARTPPASVSARRRTLTGFRVVPVDLTAVVEGLRPPGGGIAVDGPEHRVVAQPATWPEGAVAYTVALGPGDATEWTLTAWTAPPAIAPTTWLAAFVVGSAGAALGGWAVARTLRARRSRLAHEQEQEASAALVSLAALAQRSLDLADVLPAVATALADLVGARGLSLSVPSPEGERLLFVWGQPPDEDALPVRRPHPVQAGDNVALVLSRGGRTVARLRVVAGRDLAPHEVVALTDAGDVLASALVNAESFAQQRELVQRMRAVDELKTVFLATASHELRTPVGAISGYARILSTGWDRLTPDQGKSYATRLEASAERLGALVEDLLDFSRMERGAASAGDDLVDLAEVVGRILDEQADLTAQHRLTRHLQPGVLVRGSGQAVERVVTNLIGNAAKYSPAGGTIRVRVEARNGAALLVVEDEGPGVAPAERELVFSRFYRGRDDTVVRTRGAGLGLAIVSEFAAAMGGRAAVGEADGGGARFTVTYPLASPVEAAARTAVASGSFRGGSDVDA